MIKSAPSEMEGVNSGNYSDIFPTFTASLNFYPGQFEICHVGSGKGVSAGSHIISFATQGEPTPPPHYGPAGPINKNSKHFKKINCRPVLRRFGQFCGIVMLLNDLDLKIFY